MFEDGSKYSNTAPVLRSDFHTLLDLSTGGSTRETLPSWTSPETDMLISPFNTSLRLRQDDPDRRTPDSQLPGPSMPAK